PRRSPLLRRGDRAPRRDRLLHRPAAARDLRCPASARRVLLLALGPAPRALLLRPSAARRLAAGALLRALRAKPIGPALDHVGRARGRALGVPARRTAGRRRRLAAHVPALERGVLRDADLRFLRGARPPRPSPHR